MFREFGLQDVGLIAQSALVTIQVCLVAGFIGSVVGTILGLGATSKNRIARIVSSFYINMIRGIPPLVIIFFVYFGLPLAMPAASLPSFLSAAVALSVYTAAYAGEVVRGGIESVPRGQTEAADALGLGYSTKMRFIILPQAMRVIVPPGIGFLIALVKDSSLVSVVGLMELTGAARVVGSATTAPILPFLVSAAFYFVICYAMSLASRRYERKLAGGTASSARRLRKVESI